ncbi:leucine carboxyl methyltransferase 1 [Kwoniella heveanensis BCC8398]|uniref:Leucine carboxyl methyltransferase 1 n=1 Tax=Kwoniella heveanensis BCC8398 TaxID=1296120 RepID=A0A1B9GZE4_9TREE|nr:leucine carboxyl methyltransferase 1 [Kwoniella heveanensis BCC8398]
MLPPRQPSSSAGALSFNQPGPSNARRGPDAFTTVSRGGSAIPARNGFGQQQQEQQQMVHPDDAIRQTDDDAASSRLSAVNAGYLNDPFVSLLYKSSTLSHPQAHSLAAGGGGLGSGRKPPLINVGTHHRTVGIDIVVDKFLKRYASFGRNDGDSHDASDGGGCQIVSLGAGSDTRFWRLMSRPQPPNIMKYVEIDFPHLTSPKAQRIARSKKLQTAVSQGGTRLDSAVYTLLPLDLRPTPTSSPSPSTSSNPSQAAPGGTKTDSASSNSNKTSIHDILNGTLLPLLKPNVPTLFLAECLFPYMPPEDASAIIGWFGSTFPSCVGVVYEMCGLDDGFGRVMRRNLASRNLSIPGSIFPTPASQGERFLDASALGEEGVFTSCGAKTLWQVREDVIDQTELQRISKLEILDEIEELKLVLEHYVIAWGTKGANMDDIGL